MRASVVNPSNPGELRAVDLITDRAKRYRAQGAITQAELVCIYCGRPEDADASLDIEHIDGHEEHGNPENLARACRSCNVRKGRTLAAGKLGRKTRQRNPGSVKPASTAGQYALAAMVLRGESNAMELSEAIAMMHATPPDQRSRFARALYRKSRPVREANRAARQAEIPF